MFLLQHHRGLAERAFRNVSFDPEKRAEQTIKYYSEELWSDLGNMGGEGERYTQYQRKYEQYFVAWLVAQSRCLSCMIVGPARFPVARNEKFMRSEQRAYEKFRTWRAHWLKRDIVARTLSPEEEVDVTLAKLDKMLVRHEVMKGVNKILSGKSAPVSEKLQTISEEYGEEILAEVKGNFEYYERQGRVFGGFASFELTNSNSRIKNAREKLEVMRKRIARKDSWQAIKFDGGCIDIEADRVIIKHDAKPERSVIDALKARGFRWSGRHVCWCRKHTEQAVIDAKKVCGV